MQRSLSRRRAWPAIVLASVVLVGCEDWSDQSIRTTERQGDGIVAALEKYRADHQVYPAALSELVPQYVSVIDPPVVGPREWQYVRERDGKFVLFVGHENGSKPLMYRVPDGPLWIVDTK